MRIKASVLGLACLLVLLVSVVLGTIYLGPIKIDVIKTGPEGDYSFVKTKITNTSGKHINKCYLSCILYKGEEEVDVETHYAINPLKGGLKSDRFTFYEYAFGTSREEWDKVGFQIEEIDYKR